MSKQSRRYEFVILPSSSPARRGAGWTLLFVAALVIGCSKQATEQAESDSESTPEVQQRFAPERGAAGFMPPPPADTTSTAREKPSLPDLIERCDDAVVQIFVEDAAGNLIGTGSGCIVTEAGLIATNFHVLESAAGGYVKFRYNDRQYRIKGYHQAKESYDLVIVELESLPNRFEHFSLGNAYVRPGEDVYAIGHPRQLDFSVSEGIVSAIRTARDLPMLYQVGIDSDPNATWVQSTAAISGGSSGGPLITAFGDLVGLNTWFASGQNLNFAIHSQHIRELVDVSIGEVNSLPLPGTNTVSSSALLEIVESYEREQMRIMQRSDSMEEMARETEQAAKKVIVNLCELLESTESEREQIQIAKAMLEHLQLVGIGIEYAFPVLFTTIENSLLNEGECGDLLSFFRGFPMRQDLNEFLRRIADDSSLVYTRVVALNVLHDLYASDNESNRHVPEMMELQRRVQVEVATTRAPQNRQAEVAQLNTNAFYGERRGRHVTVGRQANLISHQTIDQEIQKMEDDLGKVMLIDFWNADDTSSRLLYPGRRELEQTFAGEDFVHYITCEGEIEQIRQLIDSGELTGKVFHPFGAQPHRTQSGLTSVPFSLVLDRRGIVRFINPDESLLEEMIENLLEEDQDFIDDNMIAAGSEWNYFATGADPGGTWTSHFYDDAQWQKGPAPLGYGEDWHATDIRSWDEYGPKPICSYYRHRFEVADAASVEQLYLSLAVDDGAVVYLNGVEILRKNLAGSATHDDPAGEASYGNGFGFALGRVDPSLLIDGENVVAVEVHQADQYSADGSFDLRLGTDLSLPWETDNPYSIRDTCIALSRLGYVPMEHRNRIESWATDEENPGLRMWATFLLTQLELEFTAPKEIAAAKDEAEEEGRWRLANRLNSDFWPEVISTDRSVQQYELATRYLSGAVSLAPDNPMIINSYGVGLYRIGEYEACITQLRRSKDLMGDNPMDLAFLCMAHHRLGDEQLRLKTKKRLDELMADVNLEDDLELATVYGELEETLATP